MAALAVPAAPTLRGAARSAASDFYFNSWRLVPANLVWGAGLGLLYLTALVFWPAALILAPLLALPTVGIQRIASLVVRGEAVSFWDGVRAWRTFLAAALIAGVATEIVGLVLLINLVGGLQGATPISWAFATLAGWGLVIGWLWLTCFWPLLTDPQRTGWGFRHAARAAGYLVVAHPLRLLGLGILLAVLLIISAVAFAALITISVSYSALVACHFVLPAADRLEARLAAAGANLGPRTALPEAARSADGRVEPMPSA